MRPPAHHEELLAKGRQAQRQLQTLGSTYGDCRLIHWDFIGFTDGFFLWILWFPMDFHMVSYGFSMDFPMISYGVCPMVISG